MYIYICIHVCIFVCSIVSTVHCILSAVYAYRCKTCIHPKFENTPFMSPHVIVCDLRHADRVFSVCVLQTKGRPVQVSTPRSPPFQVSFNHHFSSYFLV